MFCLYGLYRNLFKHDEDRKLWKQLWSLQKKVVNFLNKGPDHLCSFTCINVYPQIYERFGTFDKKII